MKFAVIYVVTCVPTGKIYIGSSIDFRNRWKSHRYHLNAGTHHSPYFQNAWNKHKEAAFTHSIVAMCDAEDRNTVEKYWIDTLDAANPLVGFNVCTAPVGRSGAPHKETTKQKISQAHKGKKKSQEHIEKMVAVNRNRQVSQETRVRLSKAAKGRKWTEEQKAKIRGLRTGWQHSEEAIQKMKNAAMNRTVSEETRVKISIAGKGRKWTQSQREKILSKPRDKHSESTKQAISLAKGGRPFKVVSPDGTEYRFQILRDTLSLGLDSSNVQKCLIGKAKSTKGYRCYYE